MSETKSRRSAKYVLWLPVVLILVILALGGLRVPVVRSAMTTATDPAPVASLTPVQAVAAVEATLPPVAATASPAPASRPRATPTIMHSPTAWPSSTPLPTATATPSASSTPLPTATATPSPSSTPLPTATSTPLPSPTSVPTVTPAPAVVSPPSVTAPLTATAAVPGPTPQPQLSPTPVPTVAFTKDILTILLIGGDNNYTLDMNTDTLIVAVVNKSSKQVSLLSIPRDLWVHIPTYGWGRINTAHRIGARFKYPDGGGPGLLMRTIEENLGIHIDNWVRVGYDGFARAVDEVGGVDVIIPCRVNLRYTPPTSQTEEEMILDPGAYHLDGTTALRYVRTRRGDSDFERESRQQQFLKGVWHQFRKASIIPKIPGLWSAMKGALATNLSLGDVLALAPVVLDLQPQHIRSRYIGRGQVESWTTPEGAEVLLPIPDKIQQVVAGLYAPSSGNEDQPASEAAHIQIQNGTGRSQLATIAADQLGWYGLDAVATGAADRTDYQNTQIVVLNDKPETVKVLVQAFKVKPQNVINGSEPDPAADIRVILGNDYDPCQP